MKVFHYGTDVITKHPEASLTLGTFDGVHLGHRTLLNKVLEGEYPTVVTFHPHPQHVLRLNNNPLKILTPLNEKLRKLELEGIQRTVVIPFNEEFASLTAMQFLKDLLIDTIGMKRLVVGFNHSFGKNREGSIDFMQEKSGEFGYELEIVDAHHENETTVSSTGIRNALLDGRLNDANIYLGREYRMEAEVIHGDARGRDLGYPTANLVPAYEHQLIPAEGVYAVRLRVDGKTFDGVGSIGRKETFGSDLSLAVEVHLFDVKLDLYGKNVQVEWVDFIRGQKAFDSVDELIVQMDKDSAQAKVLLKN